MKQNQLESVDGITYLVCSDEGLPTLANLDSYVGIVKDKAILRRIIFTAENPGPPLPRRRGGARSDSGQLAEESLLKLGEHARRRRAGGIPKRILEEFEGGINAFLDRSRRIKGLSTGYPKLDESDRRAARRRIDYSGRRPSMGQVLRWR